ncbi:hypothetical protein [Burkholderia ubonensis]|uniref:hypothetical protein n=1 Tax=Burkholderia ubonensis TaxID=101571 RepID=UPI0012FB01C2|nr:hypothetical protein [Burkholderia ubonensis]
MKKRMNMGWKFTRVRVVSTCLTGLISGCSVASPTTPVGAGQVAHISKTAISAYQAGDDSKWKRVVCGGDDDRAPLAGLENMRALVGDISNVRLIALSAGSDAGNAGMDLETPIARYQVTSSKYPLKELVLTFYTTERAGCVGLGC